MVVVAAWCSVLDATIVRDLWLTATGLDLYATVNPLGEAAYGQLRGR